MSAPKKIYKSAQSVIFQINSLISTAIALVISKGIRSVVCGHIQQTVIKEISTGLQKVY